MLINREDRKWRHCNSSMKIKAHTLYKVVPEHSQCELNGHGILDGQRDISKQTDYTLIFSQVEEDNLFPCTASHKTVLFNPRLSKVRERPAQPQATTITDNAAAAKLLQQRGAHSNPTELPQHANHHRWNLPP